MDGLLKDTILLGNYYKRYNFLKKINKKIQKTRVYTI